MCTTIRLLFVHLGEDVADPGQHVLTTAAHLLSCHPSLASADADDVRNRAHEYLPVA